MVQQYLNSELDLPSGSASTPDPELNTMRTEPGSGSRRGSERNPGSTNCVWTGHTTWNSLRTQSKAPRRQSPGILNSSGARGPTVHGASLRVPDLRRLSVCCKEMAHGPRALEQMLGRWNETLRLWEAGRAIPLRGKPANPFRCPGWPQDPEHHRRMRSGPSLRSFGSASTAGAVVEALQEWANVNPCTAKLSCAAGEEHVPRGAWERAGRSGRMEDVSEQGAELLTSRDRRAYKRRGGAPKVGQDNVGGQKGPASQRLERGITPATIRALQPFCHQRPSAPELGAALGKTAAVKSRNPAKKSSI
ncbi:hypothetical protein FA95DRAFT_1575756 [Auriscalpium vulgare]|uniref:Uncharacterized protein n=1 Tax=Auriscalpium vulgare TaxID=40419 RepID=A0ACB8RFL5_9AGAM|nr:hypothetical protein FA95DRAFT_1575756 [Auriscalpium vulgare]